MLRCHQSLQRVRHPPIGCAGAAGGRAYRRIIGRFVIATGAERAVRPFHRDLGRGPARRAGAVRRAGDRALPPDQRLLQRVLPPERAPIQIIPVPFGRGPTGRADRRLRGTHIEAGIGRVIGIATQRIELAGEGHGFEERGAGRRAGGIQRRGGRTLAVHTGRRIAKAVDNLRVAGRGRVRWSTAHGVRKRRGGGHGGDRKRPVVGRVGGPRHP